MPRYVIGDVQGCFEQLQQLLKTIHFNADRDQLWFCGDLIARGPQSLQTLRFVRDLADNAITVQGNHDLNFLASLHGYGKITAADQLQELQQAPDKHQLADWLLQQPLIHYDAEENLMLVHAGLAPGWSLATALEAAADVSASLATALEAAADVSASLLQDAPSVFSQMYGNQPDLWQDADNKAARWRFTINSCTRMRYCLAGGRLELKEKGEVSANPNLIPWFEFWRDKPHPTIFFGHWAALQGICDVDAIHALDTGCVWGNSLTAYCIESQRRYSVVGYKKQL